MSPPSHLITIGEPSQIDRALTGEFLHGKRDPRIAFVGRSNVGKSSLINALLGQRLARVSDQPGKTRLIHAYNWEAAGRILIDLPGYGYAKAGWEDREKWARFIEAYLKKDPNLEGVWVLLDSRHGPTDLDIEAIKFMISLKIPLGVVMTKTDQLKTQSERAKRKKEVAAALAQLGANPEELAWVSVKAQTGLKDLQAKFLGPSKNER